MRKSKGNVMAIYTKEKLNIHHKYLKLLARQIGVSSHSSTDKSLEWAGKREWARVYAQLAASWSGSRSDAAMIRMVANNIFIRVDCGIGDSCTEKVSVSVYRLGTCGYHLVSPRQSRSKQVQLIRRQYYLFAKGLFQLGSNAMQLVDRRC